MEESMNISFGDFNEAETEQLRSRSAMNLGERRSRHFSDALIDPMTGRTNRNSKDWSEINKGK